MPSCRHCLLLVGFFFNVSAITAQAGPADPGTGETAFVREKILVLDRVEPFGGNAGPGRAKYVRYWAPPDRLLRNLEVVLAEQSQFVYSFLNKNTDGKVVGLTEARAGYSPPPAELKPGQTLKIDYSWSFSVRNMGCGVCDYGFDFYVGAAQNFGIGVKDGVVRVSDRNVEFKTFTGGFEGKIAGSGTAVVTVSGNAGAGFAITMVGNRGVGLQWVYRSEEVHVPVTAEQPRCGARRKLPGHQARRGGAWNGACTAYDKFERYQADYLDFYTASQIPMSAAYDNPYARVSRLVPRAEAINRLSTIIGAEVPANLGGKRSR